MHVCIHIIYIWYIMCISMGQYFRAKDPEMVILASTPPFLDVHHPFLIYSHIFPLLLGCGTSGLCLFMKKQDLTTVAFQDSCSCLITNEFPLRCKSILVLVASKKNWRVTKSSWNRHETIMKPSWNHHETVISIIELDDGKIYRKALYLMVKTMVSA